MPELRIDPIVGRRVYIAEDRAGRPNDFVGEPLPVDEPLRGSNPASERPVHSPNCPFCAGNEAATPVEAAAVRDSAGRWQVRVVLNKFPAMQHAADAGAAFGAHEVIIESPRHLLDVVELSVDELATVLQMFRDRLQHWSADERFAHGLVFKNSGEAAGASLLHVHSQLVALPYVPEAVQTELDAAARHFASQGSCAFCGLVERERRAGERMVIDRDGFVAFCAYAGRQPLETWILPDQHAARFDRADDEQLRRLAGVLHDLLTRLHAVVPGPSYNLVLHSGPFRSRSSLLAPRAAAPLAERGASYHWHWELVPRLSSLAGLELGAGVYINPLSPEHAAQQLRSI